MRRFAISDIHGCSKTFTALLEKIGLQKNDHLYLLGDYIDRGPDSKGVIDYILDLINNGYNMSSLVGNHEWMLLNARFDAKNAETWISKNGGNTTLYSYGIYLYNELDKLPANHLNYFRSLEYFIELDDYYLVHAGFNFKDEEPFADYEAMIWIRDWQKNIQPKLLNNKKIIHGHSPVSTSQLIKNIDNKKLHAINIDCGCVYIERSGLGNLCVLNLDDLTFTTQINIDEVI